MPARQQRTTTRTAPHRTAPHRTDRNSVDVGHSRACPSGTPPGRDRIHAAHVRSNQSTGADRRPGDDCTRCIGEREEDDGWTTGQRHRRASNPTAALGTQHSSPPLPVRHRGMHADCAARTQHPKPGSVAARGAPLSLREPNTRPPTTEGLEIRSAFARPSHGNRRNRGRTHFSCHSGPVSRPGPRGAGVSQQRGRAPAGAPGGHCTYPAVARQRSATRTSSAPQHALRLRSRPCPIPSCPSRLRAAPRTSRRLTAGRGQAHIREGVGSLHVKHALPWAL